MNFLNKFYLFIKHLFSNLQTDSIEFIIKTDIDHSENGKGLPWPHTDIIINKRSIFDKLFDYEISEAQRTQTNIKLAGKYIGIDPQSFTKIFQSRIKRNIKLWQCSICRSENCASELICSYELTPLYIKFYDFRQQSKPQPFNMELLHDETIEKSKWNYSAFGPFKFNRFKFFNELRSLSNCSTLSNN